MREALQPMCCPVVGIVGGLATGPAIFLDEHGYERFRGGYRWIYQVEVNVVTRLISLDMV
jgi:hypothetical protein